MSGVQGACVFVSKLSWGSLGLRSRPGYQENGSLEEWISSVCIYV